MNKFHKSFLAALILSVPAIALADSVLCPPVQSMVEGWQAMDSVSVPADADETPGYLSFSLQGIAYNNFTWHAFTVVEAQNMDAALVSGQNIMKAMTLSASEESLDVGQALVCAYTTENLDKFIGAIAFKAEGDLNNLNAKYLNKFNLRKLIFKNHK